MWAADAGRTRKSAIFAIETAVLFVCAFLRAIASKRLWRVVEFLVVVGDVM